tara:strand:- start:2 stop:2086 length:2085 start_codon:yes stop_codon:yes gene_type:complete
MLSIQIYISGVRVDMFKDESISLNQSIQNVRDVGTIYTDYTNSYNLPASKTNNKIFKHFYNFNIDGGFDARTKITTKIELNYFDFKIGVLQLNGVKMKNNVADSYNVTFFGKTVNLKTVLAEDKLDVLDLSAYDHDYSKAIVKNALQSNTYLSSGVVVYPLIQALGNRYTFDSNTSNTDNYNVAYRNSGTGSNNTGVNYTDLKPALRLQEIINAIESRYNITFSSDFFNNSEPFASLYLWLSRNKGRIGTNTSGEQVFTKVIGNWAEVGTPAFSTNLGNTIWNVTTDATCKTTYYANLTITSASATVYTIYALDTVSGTRLAEASNISGNYPLSFTLGYNPQATYSIQWIVESTQAMTFTPTLEITLEVLGAGAGCTIGNFTNNYNVSSGSLDTLSYIYISQNVPDIKIIDFLTGIFQTWNLTAFVNDNNVIEVKTLDSYYAASTSYDITAYVESNSSDVKMALPYSDIQFKYQEPDSFLAINFNRINNLVFGDLLSPPTRDTSIDVGNKYTIQLPFSKMVFERLSDQNTSSPLTNNLSEILWGWSANADQESDLTKPLILYNVNQTISDTDSKLSFVDGASAGTASGLTTYNRPSNVNLNSSQTLNFGQEVDEYVGTVNSNSLFQNYYTNYITDVFNIKRRLTKVKAYLPLRILLNYSLADTFIINNVNYKINTVNTNFSTGQSNIELLNEIS